MNANEILEVMNIGENTKQGKVIKYFFEHKRITSWECITIFHFTRLSALIYKLKKAGVIITDEWSKGKQSDNYKIYYLGEKND